jgi:hypothetical protein
MVARRALHRALLGRDVLVAFAALAVLYLVRFVQVQALQIPAYLLIVTYDVIEATVPLLQPYYGVVFPLFLYLLAVLGAGVARAVRPTDDESWTRAVGGVFVLAGLLSLTFGALVGGPLVAPRDNPTPLAITGAAGIVLLVGGAWLARRS